MPDELLELDEFFPANPSPQRESYRLNPQTYGYQIQLEGRASDQFVTLDAAEWGKLQAYTRKREKIGGWPDYRHLPEKVVKIIENWMSTVSNRYKAPRAEHPTAKEAQEARDKIIF